MDLTCQTSLPALSHGQRALWFLDRLAPGNAAYIVAGAVRVLGAVEPEALRRALGALVGRHAALRTTFHDGPEDPVQRVHSVLEPDFAVQDASGWLAAELVERAAEFAYQGFDLERGPLVRLGLFLGQGEPVLVLALHHAVADFWSLGVLVRELGALYGEETGGAPAELAPPSLTYLDWVRQQEEWLASPEGERTWASWRETLRDVPAVLELPADRPRPAVQGFRGGTVELKLEREKTRLLARLGREQGATLAMALLAGFGALLGRWAGQERFLVGMPTTGRRSRELAGLVGYLVNPVAVEIDLRASGDGSPAASDGPGFGELVVRVRESSRAAFERQDFPLPLLAERLQPERDPSRPPLFQVMFLLQKGRRSGEEGIAALWAGAAGARLEAGPLVLESLALPDPGAQFDLTLGLAEWEGGLIGKLQYDRDLFDGATVQRLAAQLERLLAAAVAEPERPLSELELLGVGERQQVLVEWNDAPPEWASGLLHAGFLERARQVPGAAALVVRDRRLSYGELAARSLRLAARLRSLGVGPEVRVGVLCERGVELVVGLLAVLEAGGAYVPLDPAYPVERLELMLADSGAGLVLTRPALRPLLRGFDGRLEDLSEDGPAPDASGALATGAPAGDLDPGHLAYVIYTSGSTGRPKGVGITHGSAAALMRWALARYAPAELAGVLAATSVCFDLSVFELFAPLWAGGTVILAENALALPGLPAAGEVTLINTVPSAIAALVAADGLPAGVRTVNLAGEPLRRSLVEEIYRNGGREGRVERVWNLYGPTEDTTYSTEQWVDAGDQREPAIGRPLPGGRAYVLDRSGRPVPPGVAGELLLGGAGLARGYLGRGDLTAERFVPEGFGNSGPGARLYRTGDLVRQRADGTLIYLGRLDHQVKVRGFRIELGEIEAALRAQSGVREAVVVVRGGGDGAGTPALAAYVAGEGLDPAALRAALAARLPSYMVPSWLVAMPELPHLPNGKVDRKALPAPTGEEEGIGEAPATPMEEALAGIWCDLLGRDRVTREDHFFHLGGHSLLAAQLASRVRHSFGVELPLARLFAAPTLAALAREVEGSRRRAEPAPSAPLPTPSIRRRPEKGPAPLSSAQERLWFLDQLEPGSAVYNIPGGLRLRGHLDPAALEAALHAIVRRHEALRTSFPSIDGQPVQVITENADLALPLVDLAALPAAAREAELSALARAEAKRPFSLTQSLLMRALLMRLSSDRRAGDHALLITLHHIVSDGWSLGVLVRELGVFYRACLQGSEPSLPALPVQYAGYASWQRGWLESGELERQLVFWRAHLAGLPEALDLPADLPRPAVQSHRGGQLPIELDASLAAAVRELARREEATPFLVLLAGFAALLSRLSGQEDIAVGSPVAGRTRLETEGLIGLFVNTLVLRCDLSGDPPFREALSRVRGTVLAASAHQDVPFEKLVEALAPERDRSRSPLFQVMLAHQRSPLAGLELAGLEVEPLAPAGETAKFDLTLSLEEQDDRLAGSLEYSRDLFHRATARRLLEQFRRLLDAAVTHPELPVSELPLLSEAERQQLQVEWADPGRSGGSRETGESGGVGEMRALGASAPAGSSLPELFEAQARRTPDAVAVLAAGKATTYGDLDAWAERLAGCLRAQGVGPEIPVGVCSDRSPRLIAALLGVLKAGGAYVPLDPSYPRERLARMLEDCRVVLAPSELRDRLPESDAAVLDLPDYIETSEESPASRLSSAAATAATATAGNLAYVIYTSGSTGRPKGVAIEHRSAVALVRWAAAAFSPDELARVLAATSVCFDLSVFELFVPLGLGGTVVLVRDALALLEDGPSAESGVTLINTVPSAIAEVVRAGRLPASVQTVNLAGEPLTGALARAVLAAGAGRLLNLYGPSEDTTYSTVSEVAPTEPGEPTIGRALPGTAALVLDRRQQPVPAGVPGELCLAGEGLARGYLGRPDLTAERFVPAPDGWSGLPPGARIYRTGDLARWLPDGRLAFLGRVDHQVKVRGFRIELGEVEAALRACPGVREAVVVVRPDLTDDSSADPRLVAYFTTDGPPPSADELRDLLAARLPGYMVPADWVALASLPLSANGKVDRRALPAPGLAAGRAAPRAPGTPTEEAVAAIWAEVLGRPRTGMGAIGADDHFFHLGGHSLLATRVAARIRAALGVDLPLGALFAAPTVAGLSAEVDRLRALGGSRTPALFEPGKPGEPGALHRRPGLSGRWAPASFAQERLWFLDKLHPGSPVYNMSSGLRLQGPLSIPALAAALDGVVRRHEVLRTTLSEQQGEAVQVIAPPEPRPLPVIDLSGLAPAVREAAARDLVGDEARRPFDLARGPLLRVTAVRLAAAEHAVLASMHHAVSDLWSIGIFHRELAALYVLALGLPGAVPPADLPLQYGDAAAWQRGQLASGALDGQKAYWRERLAGAPAGLDLPTDRPRPQVQTLRGRQLPVRLPAIAPGRLAALSGASAGAGGEMTPFMVYLAAWSALLGRLTGQEDLVVGTPIAGRTHPAFDGLIGFFVNLLPLRVDLAGDPELTQLLDRVRDTTLGAYSHQELPFDKLIEDLALARDPSRSPLFQVLFALQNAPASELELPGLAVTPLPADTGTARFDLSLALSETADSSLTGFVELNTDLFDIATVQRILRQLEVLLGALADDPAGTLGRRVSDCPLLGAGERAQLVAEWNDTALDAAPRCLHALVAERAADAPQSPALAFGDRSQARLTYGELDRRANHLARRLRGLGVEPEERVGVCLPRSAELIVTLLAVLKAGGAYVPLDPDYPAERLAYMMADARIRVLVTRGSLGVAGPPAAALVDLDEESGLRGEDDVPPTDLAHPDHPAYVIYTSGSTGRPKGVVVTHAGVCNLVMASPATAVFPGDRVGQGASISFDAATWEIWATLLNGACLVGIPREVALAPRRLAEFLVEQRMTVLLLATALFHQVAAEAPSAFGTLRLLLFGGEAADPRHPRAVLRQGPPGRLFNGYGPTETTCFSTGFTIEQVPEGVAVIPLGRPIGNTAVHVVDWRLRPVPVGAAGELGIAGAGLARGYSGRPDLTAERFVPLPPDLAGPPGARLYRTGDRVRRRPDGLLEFLGRIDNQVKLRGYRIELGEIGSTLLEHPAVREAVVLALGSSEADRRLAAYVTVEEGEDRTQLAPALRDWLQRRVPAYMVPAGFTVLEKMPISATGKIDRAALAALGDCETAAGAVPGAATRPARPPRTATEEAMVRLWQRVLAPVGAGRGFGVDDGFFELGGHSLLAVRLVSQVQETFGVEVSIQALFAAPTVAALAAEVDRLRAPGAGPAELGPIPRLSRLPGQARPDGSLEAPAAFAQERLWFIDQLEGGSSAYNIPATLGLTGKLDPAVFAAALAGVVRRHDSLRTTFAAVRARPVQVIAPPDAAFAAPAALLPVVDLAALPESPREAEARALAEAEARRPFDLARGPLLRATLVHLAAERAVLLLDLHHIISDGWSMGVLLRELAVLYEAFAAGRPSPLPELPVQFADFAAWQRSWLSGEVLEREIRFWREQMAGAPAVLHLPADHPRPPVQSRRGGHRFIPQGGAFDGRLGAGLRRLARSGDATLFMVLMAGYQALLSRLTGADDLPVGSPVAGRGRLELEGVIGFFVNVVVLRGDLTGRPSFAELVGRVRETSLATFAHQDLPFEKLVEAVRPERDLAHTPLFQVMFALQNTPLGALRLPGVTLDLLPVESGQAKFDLSLALAEAGEGLRGSLEYSRDLFEAATAERLLGQLAALLAGAVAEPERHFRDLPLLSAAERQQALWEWNGRGAVLSGSETVEEPLVPALFEARAARRPAAPALLWQGGSRSYGELNARANRVAHHLRALGVEPEVVVGVVLERSPDTVAGLLGILKAGGAYLPLDLALPVERLRFMAEDAGVRLLLTERRLAAELERALPADPGDSGGLGGIRSVLIEDCCEVGPETDPPAAAAAGNAAYVIYTSGSAGRPKGVVVPYGAFSHRMRYVRDREVREGDRFLHKTTLSFDASIGELFGPLVSGGAVVLAAPGEERDIPGLIRLITAQEVTQIAFTASTLSVLLQDSDLARCGSLRKVLTGGEAVPVDLPGRVERLLAVELFNRYGPTETTISVISGRCSAGEVERVVPIGRPIADAEVYLLDPGLQPVPAGVAGELCIGGPVLARGYLRRPDLTAASFIPHPFALEGGARLYKSGDLARFRPDGVIEFVGRVDQQVKIRGFRVELGEIEALLVQYPAVQDVAVAVRGEGAARRLVAFVVPRPGEAVTAEGLQAHLADQVPAYMVPAGFVFLDALPMLHAGKVDRRELQRIDDSDEQGAGRSRRPYEPPGTPVEELLAGIFAEVLGAEQVGIHDDFFDLGGHSLQVTQVLLRVKEELAVELPVRDFFEQPTVAGLSLALAEQLVAFADEEQLAEILAGLE